jgi:hypothetical protein
MMEWKPTRGYGRVEARSRELAEIEMRRKKGAVRELFLTDMKREVVVRFLEDEPVCVMQHRRQVFRQDGRARWERITCLRDNDTAAKCPFCTVLGNPTLFGYFTVVDRSMWEEDVVDPQGRKDKILHCDEKKMWVRGVRDLERIKAKRDRWGGLTGMDILISRIGSGQSVTYDYEKLEGGDPPKGDLTPFDWAEILKPPSLAEACAMLGMSVEEFDDPLAGIDGVDAGEYLSRFE